MNIALVHALLLVVGLTSAQNVPPSIYLGPSSAPTYFSAALDSLYCLATGTELTYVWYLNGAPLDMNGYKATMNTQTGQLIVPSPVPEGYYQCQVQSHYGIALSNVTKVVLIRLDAPQGIADAQYTPTLGSSLALMCNTSLAKIVPRAVYKWQLIKDRQSLTAVDIQYNQRVTVMENGTLFFAVIQAADSQQGYYYRCHLTNVENNDKEMSLSYSKINLSTAAAVVPTTMTNLFASPSPVIGLLERQQVVLRCFFGGASDITISWSYNGQPRQSGRFIPLVQSGATLTITQLQVSDAGTYTCTGMSATLPSASATVNLVVEAAPVFVSAQTSPTNMNATVGSTVTMYCNTAAIPTATVQWFQNGKPLDPARLPAKVSINTAANSLSISQLCKGCGDAGDLSVIQCNASNKHGYVLGQGYINPLDPTIIQQSPVNAWLDWPNSVNFTCLATTDVATPLTYTWTLNGQPISDGQVNTSVPGLLSINIQNANDKGQKYMGTWAVNVSNGVSSVVAQAQLNGVYVAPASLWQWWSWIPLVIVLVLFFLILIIFLICCHLYQNRGDHYPVDEVERKNGNDPKKDLENNGFKDYQRPLVQYEQKQGGAE